MSIESASARMLELQRMLLPPAIAPATPPAAAPAPTGPTAPSAFQAALAGATAPAVTTAAGGGTVGTLEGVPFGGPIAAAARKHGVDPALLAGLIRQESNFDPGAVSPAGARGLTQLMPGTAASVGVRDASDPLQAIEGGATYLKQQLDRFGGDVTKALAAYNAGPGAVERFGGVPPYAETRAYVEKVQAFADQYRSAQSPASVPSTAPAAAGRLSYPTL